MSFATAVLFLLVGALVRSSVAQAPAPAPAYTGLYDSDERWTGTCVTGRRQSPIDVNTDMPEAIVAPGAITLNYSTSAVVNVTNADKGLQINVPGGSTAHVAYGDKDWTLELKQIHFHHPAEHIVNNMTYELEAHLVHQIKQTGGYAVFGIRSAVAGNSKSNALLLIALALGPSTYEVVNQTVRTWNNDPSTLEIDLEDLFEDPLASPFIHYEGSLTTPPCTEIVQWFLFLDTQTVGQNQLEQYKQYVNKENDFKGEGNRRSSQALNDRTIELVEQSEIESEEA